MFAFQKMLKKKPGQKTQRLQRTNRKAAADSPTAQEAGRQPEGTFQGGKRASANLGFQTHRNIQKMNIEKNYIFEK